MVELHLYSISRRFSNSNSFNTCNNLFVSEKIFYLPCFIDGETAVGWGHMPCPDSLLVNRRTGFLPTHTVWLQSLGCTAPQMLTWVSQPSWKHLHIRPSPSPPDGTSWASSSLSFSPRHEAECILHKLVVDVEEMNKWVKQTNKWMNLHIHFNSFNGSTSSTLFFLQGIFPPASCFM